MNCWIVVNSFVNSNKFTEIYNLLEKSGKERSINVEVKKADEIMCDMASDYKEYNLPDFCLYWDKDIITAKRLESVGVPLFNSSSAVEICDNKILTAISLHKDNVIMPKTIAAPKTFEGLGYNNLRFLNNVEKELQYPFIMKEAYGSFGKQVYLVENRSQAESLIKQVGCKPILFQKYIEVSRGRDIRINVVGGKVIASMERYNENDFRSNLTNGGKARKIKTTKEQEELAIRAANAIGLDFAGVDVLFGENGPIICEVNSNPHFKSTLDCTGIDISPYIFDHILEKLNK